MFQPSESLRIEIPTVNVLREGMGRQGKASMSDPVPLTFQRYQDLAISTDRKRDPGSSLDLYLLGLFGETGSLLSEVKKKQRDAAAYLGYTASVVEELGDVLWY